MGFSGAIRATTNSEFGNVSDVFALDEVRCIGSESNLVQCPHDDEDDCLSSEGAGVVCDTDTTPAGLTFIFIKILIKRCLGFSTYQRGFLNGSFPASFDLFSFFQYSWQWTSNCRRKKFADDWNRTANLRCWTRPLYQLSYNPCPNLPESFLIDISVYLPKCQFVLMVHVDLGTQFRVPTQCSKRYQ